MRCPASRAGHLRALQDELGERPRAGLRRLAGERRVVGGGHLVAGVDVAAAPHEEADRQLLDPAHEGGELVPGLAHLLAAGEDAGVHDHQAVDALAVLDGEPQADRAAPVVDHERRAAQVEVLQQRGRHRHVAVVRVPVGIHRLVGAAEAGEVGQHDPVARVEQRGGDLAPQVAPGRLAVPHHHRRAVALVDVRHPQPVDLPVVRRPREAGQVLEQLVGRADRVGHGSMFTRSSSGSSTSASDAAVMWIARGSRTQEIAFSDRSRSSTNWKASACRRER